MATAISPPRPAHRDLARDILDGVLLGRQPADQALSALFRRRPEMGSRDRRAVAEPIYRVLHHPWRYRSALAHAGFEGSEADGLLGCAWLEEGLAPDLLAHAFDWPTDGTQDLAAALARPPAALPPSARLELPPAALARLSDVPALPALASALNAPAPVDLRLDPRRLSRARVLAELAGEIPGAAPTPYSPWGIRLPGRVPSAVMSQLSRRAGAEPQDEGSQLLALLTGVEPGQTVVDFCAGAGGKTLAMLAMMDGRGRMLASDVSPTRLGRLAERVQRHAAAPILHQLSEADGLSIPGLEGQADVVLVDAPCSGLGTLRRQPDLRLGDPDFAALIGLQGRVLAAAARLLAPGGRLVYATCSPVPDENVGVVARFLERHPRFEQQPARPLLARLGVRLPGDDADPWLVLRPDTHGTDAFQAAVLTRAS